MSDEDPEILKDEIEHLRYVVSKLTNDAKDTFELRLQLQSQTSQTQFWKSRSTYWLNMWADAENRLIALTADGKNPSKDQETTL